MLNSHVVAIDKSCFEQVLKEPLKQWSYGQMLILSGTGLNDGDITINFSTDEKRGSSVGAVGRTENNITMVEIPQQLLEQSVCDDYNIYAFVFVTGKNCGQTMYKIIMNVLALPKPKKYKDDRKGKIYGYS